MKPGGSFISSGRAHGDDGVSFLSPFGINRRRANWRRFILFLSPVLFVASLAGCGETDIDDSLVYIEVKDGSGSGFVVAPGGYVATNNHVIETSGGDAPNVIVFREGTERRPYRANIVWASDELDLAILQIPGLNAPALPINDGELEKEDRVRAAGFPAASNAVDRKRDAVFISTRTGGQISRFFQADWKNIGRQVKVVQHTAAINGGSSGGPLINQCDEVVGINTFVARSYLERIGEGNIGVSVKHGTFFASHASELASILRVRGIPADIRSNRCGESFLSSSMVTAAIAVSLVFMFGFAAWYLVIRGLAGDIRLPWLAHPRHHRQVAGTGPAHARTRIYTNTRWLLRGQMPDTGQAISLSMDENRIGESGAIILGRDPAFCELVISDATVSSRGHAKFFRAGDSLMVADLRSTNGTSVDGVRLGVSGAPDAAPLRDGMTLTVGAVQLTVARIEAGQGKYR